MYSIILYLIHMDIRLIGIAHLHIGVVTIVMFIGLIDSAQSPNGSESLPVVMSIEH